MPWRKRFICRFVSIVTVVLFTISETLFLSPKGFAGEPSAISSQFPSALHHPEAQATYGIGIPSEFGRTDEVFAGRSDKKIVFIQDAHDSLEAQENTARIIGHLVGKQGVRTVFEEGYEGEVPTDRYFGWIKDAALKKQIAYFLLDQLRLSGSEYAHVLGDTPFKLVGIDNASLHRQNIRQYRASLLNRPRIEKDLNVLEEGLQTLASAHFSGKLKEWLDIKRRLDRGQLPLADYIRRAYSLLPEDVRSDLGGKLRVIPLLADPAGPSQDTTKGEDIANTNPQELFDEIDGLEDALGKVFLQSDLARKIYDFLRLIYLLKRLNGLEITLREYQSLRMLWGKSGTRAIGRLLVAQTGKPLALSKRWERNIRGAVSFYGLAHERDRGISKSLDTFLAERGESTAVLVFGGFHKESIRRILRAKNISYVIVTPKISELSPKHQQYYKQLMSVGRHSYETSWAVKTAVAPERVYSGVRAEDFWDYLANLPLTTAQRQLLATQLPSLMKREKGRSELRSDEKRPPFAFKTQGLTDHQKEVVYEAADWMVKAIRKEPSVEPLSDSEVRYLNGRLDEVKVVSFVSMMTLAWRQIALKGPVSSSGYSRRLLGVGGRRILPILLSPFYFILRTVTEYFSNRYLFFGSFEDVNKTIYLTPRLRAAADTLFKRVVRHELAHALGYDDNELSFLGYLEDAKVPFNETEIKANFPSPVMAEIFDRAKTMGFPELFGEDNLPEHYERTRGPWLTFPKDLVERDGEFRRAWKASFLPAGYFIGHQIGCFAFKCWYRFVLSPVSRHLRMLRVIRSGRLRELDFYLTRMARNGLTFEFSTWIYRRILRRAEQTLRRRFFLLKGIDPAFLESYSNQSARLGMVIAFISSRPGLTDAERYQYAKVMIARAKDSGLAAAAEDIDRMIAARSELRSQPANDDSMRLTAQDFPELSKLIEALKANIARAVSAKFLPQISKVYPSASDGRRRILYPGSGADASSFFLATNATEGFFVTLENAALPGLKESLREFSESKGVNYLFQKGPHLQHFSVSKTLVEYPNILPLAVFEILGLGAEEVALRDHGSGKIEIQFDWRHPGDPAPKRRSLILISSSDLGKYETYGGALPQGLDGVFTKAIGGGKYFSPDFEQKIAGKLSAEAVIVTDHPANWAISLGGEEEFFYPEEFSGGSPQGGALTDYPFGHAKVAFLKRNPAGSMTDSERLSLILDDLDDAKAPWLHPRFTGFFLGQFQKRPAAFEQLAERIERISGQIGAPGVLRWQNRELITRLRKYVNLLGLIGDRLDREKAGRVLGLLTSFSNLAAFDNEGSDLTIPLKLLSLVVRAKIMQEIFGDTESKDRLLAEAEGLASSDHGWNSDAMRDFVRDQAAFFDVARSEMRDEEQVLRSLPHQRLRELYGFQDASAIRLLYGGGSSKIDESPVLIGADGKKYVLRHLDNPEKAKHIIAYQLRQKEKGNPVPGILRTLGGENTFHETGKIYYLEEYLTEGAEVEAGELGAKHYAGMGKMLARLHNAVEGKTNTEGQNRRRLREEVGAFAEDVTQRVSEIQRQTGPRTEGERLLADNYDFLMSQFSVFAAKYNEYLMRGIPDIAVHGDFAYTNLRFYDDGEVAGIFDMTRTHNAKAIVDLNQVVFGRKDVGPIRFNPEFFISALEAYQKEANRKLGAADIRGLLEVLRSRFLEDIYNSLVNKAHRYYAEPSHESYRQRVGEIREVVGEFKAFVDYARDLEALLEGIEADAAKGAGEQEIIEERVFPARDLLQSLPLLVSVYAGLSRRAKGIVLREFSDLIYYRPDSEATVLCMKRLAWESGTEWSGAVARIGGRKIAGSVAALREIMLDPLKPHTQIYERLARHYGIETSDAERREINRFIRGQALLQDLLLYKSRRLRSVGIMRALIHDPRKVSDILDGKFCPLTGEIHPGTSCGKIRCKFCYNAKVGPGGLMLAPIDYAGKENALGWEDIKRLADDYIDSGVKEIYVSGGKEPWYSGTFKDSNKTTVDLIRYMHEKNPALIISMLTIGLELYENEEARKTAVDAMDILRVSLDASGAEGYDDIKGLAYLVRDGKPSDTFEKVRMGIAKTLELRKRAQGKSRLRIGMSFTCSEQNYHELAQFLKIAKEWGVDFVDIKGVIADPKSEEKIRAFMGYIAGMYDLSLNGAFGDLAVYFHESFFKKSGMKFEFDEEVKVTDGGKPDKCYLARSGMRTAVVIPNGRAFVCVNSSQPGYDSILGAEWDKFRLGVYRGAETIRGLVEKKRRDPESHINCRNCKHGTSTDENINEIFWKLERDGKDGLALADQPFAAEPGDQYYDGRAIYHRELPEGPLRQSSQDGALFSAESIRLPLPDAADATVNAAAYAEAKLPSEMVGDLKAGRFSDVEIHLGTIDDTDKMLAKIGENGGQVKKLPLASVYGRLGEDVYKITGEDGGVRFMISSVRGRLTRFLAILKTLDVPLSRIHIRDFDVDWVGVYKAEISPYVEGSVEKVVISQNPVALAQQIKARDPAASYREFRGKHLQYVLVSSGGQRIILFNLSDVYGTQIVKILQYATLPGKFGGLGAKDVLLLGECGGVAPELRRGDLVLPTRIYENGREVGKIDSKALAADLRRLKNESPAGRIFSGAIETMPTILSESKKQMIDQRGKNILGIELELAHALRFLEGSKDIRLNAVLEVTDLPGMQNQRLGDLGLGARLEQSEMGELVAAVIAEDLKLRVIEKQMRAIAETGKSLLKTAHIPGILDGIKSGMIGLKGEDIDVIGVNSSGEEIVLGPLDRNIVHLYFAPDGTFMRSADEKLFLKTGAKQLLHRVANILVTTPDGRLILRQGFKENGGAGTTNVFGGHVLASVSYAETAEKELKEELGFPADYRLQGKFELLGAEGQFYAIRGWEPDRITFYRYIPSEEEIRIIESESKRLNARREEIGEAAFAGELKAIREKGAGGGEVWAIHFVPLGHFSEAQKEINPGRTLLGFISDQGLFKTLPAGFGMGKSVPIVHERPWRAKIDKSIAASVEAAVPIMRAAVLNAGTRIEVWRQKLDTLKKFDKTDKTIVTEADLDVESALLDELQKTLSFNFKVIAEEKEGELGERIAKINGQNKESPWTVVIDPIDGTQEFVDRSSQYFGALLSLQFEGEVLAAFMVCPEYRLSGEQEGGTLFEGVRVNGRFAVHRIKDGKILTSEVITPQAEKPLRDYQGGTVLFQLPLTPEEFNTAGFMTEVKKTPSTGLMLAMLAYRGGGGVSAYLSERHRVWDLSAGLLFVELAGMAAVNFSSGEHLLPLRETTYDESAPGVPRVPKILIGPPVVINYILEGHHKARSEMRASEMPPAMPKDKFNYWIIRYNRELTDLSKKFKKNQLTGGEFLRFVKQRVRHANPSFQLSVPIDPQAKVTALQLAYFQEDLGKQVIAPNGHLMIKDRFGRGGYLMEIIPSRTEHLVTPGGLPVTVYAVEEPEECAFEALLNMRDEIVYSVTHERRLLEAGRSLQSSAARISGLDVEPTPLREVPQAFSARVLSALFEQYGLEEAVRVMRRSDLTEEMGHADALSYAGKLSRELNDDYMQDQYFRIAEALVRPDSYLRQLLTEAPGRQDARNALGMSVFEVEGKLNAIARGPAPAYAFMNIVEGLLAGEFRGKADHGEGGLHGMYSNAKEVILALLAPELLHKTENVTAGDWIDFLEENSLKDGKIDVSALEEKVLSAAERVYRKQFLTLTERQLEVLAADAASNLKQEQIPEIMAALEKGELKLKGEDLDVLKIVDGKEVVIGQIDRNIAHAYGLMHRVPTTFIVTPEGKFLFQRRAHNLAEPLRISLFGGHVKAGHGYLDTIRDEIVEELGLPKDWVVDENRLKIIRTEGAFGSPEGEAFARNRERRSHYVYFTTAEEIEIIRERGRELERKLAELGEVGFKAWLVREQEANNGLGEVWSVHEYDYDELAKHSAEEFSSDLLLPLLTHPANEDVRTFLKEAATPTRPDRSEMRNGTEKMTARDALYSLGNSGGFANVKSKARSFDAFEKLGLDYPAGVVIGAGAAAAIKDGRAEFLRELIGEIKKRFESGVKVAVRSSPLISMPGRMESVLNVDVADTQALEAAIVEVARSWDNPEAVDFRRASNLPDDQGTEIIIQEMVPQDNVRRWASGTFFTRDPEHGWTGPYGRYLLNSHGAGLMTGGEKGETIHQLSEPLRERFQTISGQLEKHFGFPQEVEFLVSFKDAAGDAKPGELMPEKIWLLSSRDMVFSPQGEAKFLRQIKDPFQRVSWLEKMQQRRSSKGVRKQYKLRNGVASRSLSNQWLSRGEAIGGAMEGFLVVRPESFPKYEAEHKPVILIMTPDTQDEMLAIALRYPGAGAITNYGNSASHEAVLFRLAGIPAVIRSDVVADNSGASFRQDFGNRQYVKEGDKILLLGDGLVSLPPEKAVIEEDPVVRDFVHGIDMAEYKQAMMEAFMTPEGKVKPEVTYQQLVEANADAWSSYIKMDSMGLGKEAFEANVRKHYLHEILSFKGAEEGRDKESIRKDIVEALLAKLSIPFADDPAAHGSPPKGEIPFAEITTNWMREGYEIVNRWVGYCPPQYEGNEGVKAFKQRYDQAFAYSQALAETVGGEVRTHKVTLIYHEKIHEANEDYLSYIAVVKKRERLLPSDSSGPTGDGARQEMRNHLGSSELTPAARPGADFRTNHVVNPMGDVVFVMEQKTIDALPAELWRELIGLALIHKTRFHLVIPDAARAGYSARVEQLKGSARVHFDLPGITRNRKSRLVALSDTRKDIERFREALGEELSQKVYGYLGADRPGDFSVALLYAIGDISRQELSEKDGYLHDETGRFAAEALETLYAAYEVIVTAA